MSFPPKPSKEKIAALASKTVRAWWESAFFLLSVVQYIAYYEGLNFLFQGVVNRWWAMMALCFTYMFRLDFLAAVIGLYGAWKVWHWHLWAAVMLTAFFGGMSFVINYGPGKKPVSFFRQLWPGKKKAAPKPEAPKEDAKKDEP